MPSRRLATAVLPPLALLALACASGGPSTDSAVEPAARSAPAAEIPDLELRALLLLLVDRQTYDAYAVDQALVGGPELRRQLATTLGRVGELRGVTALESLLVDEVAEVRRAAAFALGQLGQPSAARALGRAVADPDRRTGELAVEALARLGAELSSVAAAGARLEPGELEARLLPALWRFPGVDVVRRGERALARAEPERRRQAAFALTRNPLREALPAIRRLLDDADPRIRAWAARAIGRIGDGADLDRLLPLVDGAETGPAIRALAAGARLVASGRAAPAEAWRPRLSRLLDAPHPGVRLAAVEAAGAWLLDDRLADRLVELSAAGPPAIRRAALLSLAAGGEPRAASAVFAAAGSAEVADRAAAAAAAAILGELELVRRLSGDDEAGVRQEALAALLEEEELATLAVTAGLSDPDPGVRAATLAWLAGNPVVPVLDLLAPFAGERYAGELPELPLLGIRAIVARAAAGDPAEVEVAAFALERLATGDSHLVRRAAADALEDLGRTRPPVGTVDTGRQVADYRLILEQTWRPREIELRTVHGPIRLWLACREAPLNCLNLLQLVELGFYDGLTFHRVVPDFVVQAGDPRGDGWGGPGYTVRDELSPARFEDGTLGMALGGADTGGSQFFLTLSPQPHLDGGFTAFGRVVEGRTALERIVAGDRIVEASVVGAR